MTATAFPNTSTPFGKLNGAFSWPKNKTATPASPFPTHPAAFRTIMKRIPKLMFDLMALSFPGRHHPHLHLHDGS